MAYPGDVVHALRTVAGWGEGSPFRDRRQGWTPASRRALSNGWLRSSPSPGRCRWSSCSAAVVRPCCTRVLMLLLSLLLQVQPMLSSWAQGLGGSAPLLRGIPGPSRTEGLLGVPWMCHVPVCHWALVRAVPLHLGFPMLLLHAWRASLPLGLGSRFFPSTPFLPS